MIDPKDITIIIPHLGATPEAEYALDQCLQSLRETVPGMKTIISINGSMKCGAKHDLKGYEVLIGLEEQGQCRAVNAAVATINTKWIFVTNDDMIYAPGWFEKLANTYWDIGCVSPMLIEPRPGAPTFEVFFAGGAGGDFDKEKWLEFAKTHMFGSSDADVYGRSMRTGFNLPFLIRRDIWDTVGGYDINYDPWGSNSDSDLLYKIKLAGIQPMQNPNVVVYHFSQTSGTFEPRNDSYRFKNYAYFKEKWGFDRTDAGIWEASFTVPSKEEGRIFNPSWEGKYAGH